MNSAARKSFFITRAGRGSVATALVLSTLAFTHAGCSKAADKKNDSTCSGSQALSKTQIAADATMPLKTLSLTFDDGPGLRTVELSKYLKAEGIRATFFVWGQALQNDGAGPSTMAALVADGHLIANHTQRHVSLTSSVPALTGPEIVKELTDVDTQIAPFVKDNVWLFRAPYGQWDDATAAAIEKTPMNKYVGPINWNIGGSMNADQAADAECWKTDANGVPAKSVAECGALYLKEIDAKGKGIVLLHDPYFIVKNDPTSGGTYDMIQNIVPVLKGKGYKFVRLDEVPNIAALLPNAPKPDGGTPGPDAGGTTSGGPGGTSGGPDTDPCP